MTRGPSGHDEKFQCPLCGGSAFGSLQLDPKNPHGKMQRFCHGNDARDGKDGCGFTWHEEEDWKHFLVDGQKLTREAYEAVQTKNRSTPIYGKVFRPKDER